jgi:hypothetical protein
MVIALLVRRIPEASPLQPLNMYAALGVAVMVIDVDASYQPVVFIDSPSRSPSNSNGVLGFVISSYRFIIRKPISIDA